MNLFGQPRCGLMVVGAACVLPKDHLTELEGFYHSSSNLVLHAYTELMLIGEDPATIRGFLRTVQSFSDMGHSGESMFISRSVLNRLLGFDNLSPLSDDPAEWEHHSAEVWGEPGGIWQSRRKNSAFSQDGGKTYYLLSELSDESKVIHETEKHSSGEESQTEEK